ncbi:MAG: response regulator [Lachnospiraceae bacterium]
MRYITIEEAKEGMILGKGIYDFSDRNLLSEGKTLSYELIERLTSLGYPGLYIEDDLSKDIIIQAAISDELRNSAVNSFRKMDVDGLIIAAGKIVEQITQADAISLDLVDLRTYDDYTFRHSVNVAVFATVIGMGLGYTQEEMLDVCIAGIFHDFGKLFIDKKILNKPGRLNDAESKIIKSHSQMSYDMLTERWNIASRIKMGVLCHHENEDGSGYPKGLSGDKIHPFAKIIHVADVYDALSSRRPYKEACSFSEALEYLMGGGGTLFDREMVQAFMHYVPVYPKGMKVELSDGREAIVVENYSQNLLRPKLKLFDGSILELQDVSRNRNITVVRQVGKNVMISDDITQSEKMRNQRQMHILVVDDMVTSLRTTKEMLEGKYEVSLVKSGTQALEFIQKSTPDLILMDVAMPGKSGIQTVKEIKEQFPNNIPVIFVSAMRDLQTILACKDICADDFVVKPFEQKYLLERIAQILGEQDV